MHCVRYEYKQLNSKYLERHVVGSEAVSGRVRVCANYATLRRVHLNTTSLLSKASLHLQTLQPTFSDSSRTTYLHRRGRQRSRVRYYIM